MGLRKRSLRQALIPISSNKANGTSPIKVTFPEIEVLTPYDRRTHLIMAHPLN